MAKNSLGEVCNVITVLLSGGLDSAVALAQRAHEENVCALSILYGQKHLKEVEAARTIAGYYDVPWHSALLPHDLFASGALTGDDTMPHMTYDELHDAIGPSPTYVPFRNGTLLSLAVAFTLTNSRDDSDEVVIAAHAEDAHNFAYPDCTPEFLGAFAAATYIGTYHKVHLTVPFQRFDKSMIVATGQLIGVPFEKTWSCYEGRDVHCGRCPTCIGRADAFMRAGVDDPTLYATPA